MAYYYYRGKTEAGRTVSGKANARDARELYERLRERQIFAHHIKESTNKHSNYQLTS